MPMKNYSLPRQPAIKCRLQPVRPMRGVALMEVLIAALVLTIGLLGFAGMLLTGVRFMADADAHSQTSMMAYDIADRMRANRVNAITNQAYDIAIGASSATLGIVGDDLRQWKTALAQALPNGDGQVDVNPVTGVAVITVQWSETGDGATASSKTETTRSFRLETRL